jgi:competence protein ComEC
MNGVPQSLRVHVFDVDEGQAVLVQKGSQGALVDTGSMVRAASLVQKISSSGVDHLQAIVLTHLHPDHATGFFRVREAYPNAMVLHNGHHAVLNSSLDSIRWVADALQVESNVKVFRADDVLELAGARLRALWPQEPLSDDLNQSSLVLSVESAHGERYALLMGDVGWSVEEELISNRMLTHRYPVLVAGHHGSRQTAGEGFLAIVQPEQVAISVNANNIRGYPDADTLGRYVATGATVLITYRDGDLCLTGFEQGQITRCD